ncbi:cytochrome c554 and C-prime [Leptospira levettii]|uniref:multiheme c-type cytochrome n=1 Tax=Leptospira levettii TaxID=2023178 RepID=UPI0010829FC1|nr:multiheme c-type cytochrome [Leptospira levettii]TGM91548.1 cytochrome c554 and C-prime [Leptospira levettii]
MKFLTLQLSLLFCFSINLSSCKENSFLVEHWNHPLPLLNGSNQGKQLQLSSMESNMYPKQCATCHEIQWKSWKSSFHAKSIGNGLLWQKTNLESKEYNNCLNCHSPLQETKAELSETFRTKEIIQSQKEHFPKGISNPSIQCASCHIRNQTWYGPQRKNFNRNETENDSFPHNGFKAIYDFESSLFCKSCHESPENGVYLNGKQLMEVYKEWENSSFAKQGIQCQNCHMPDREHSWKGIHDPDFVRKSVEPSWKLETISNGEIRIFAELKSIAVGHKFPTYLVPKIYLRFYTIEANGKKTFIEESIIGRLVNTNLSEEYYDTRISPNDKHTVDFTYKLNNRKVEKIVWETIVDPDEHYVRSFEESLQIKSKFLSEETKKQLTLSLSEKRESEFKLFTLSLPMPVLLRQ